MSRIAETTEALAVLNTELANALQENDPCNVTVNGRPRFFVPSINPLVYERYTRRHRAPRLAGEFALAGFFWFVNREQDLVYPYGAVRAQEGLQYGIKASAALILATANEFDIELTRTT